MAILGAPLTAATSAGGAIGGAAADVLAKFRDALKDVAKVVEATAVPALKAFGDVVQVALIPALKGVADLVKTSVVGSFQVLTAALKPFGPVATAAAGALGVVGAALKPLTDRLLFVADTVKAFASNALGLLASAFKPVTDRLLFAADVVKAFAGNVGGVLRDTFGGLAGKVGGWLSPVAEPLKRVASAVGGYLGGIGSAVQKAVGSIGSALGSMASAAGVAVGAVVAIGMAMKEMVKSANPVVAEQFTFALNDLMAVVGQALVPVFRIVTDIVRALADTLVTFSASVGGSFATVMEPMKTAFGILFDVVGRVGQAIAAIASKTGPALGSIFEALGAIATALQPIMNLLVDMLAGVLGGALGALADVIKAIVPYVHAFADVLGRAVKWIADGVRELLALIGIDLPEGGPGTREGASVGAATRSASTTDVESVLKKARESAYSLGTASREDPARRTASAAEEIRATSREILAKLNDLPERLARAIAGDTIVDAVEYVAESAEGMVDAVGDLKNGVLGAVGLREDRTGGGAVTGEMKAIADRLAKLRWSDGSGAVAGGDF